MEILVFEVASHRYGISLTDAEEIVPAATFVPLPQAPAIIEGAINYRGTVVPVLDFRARFRLPRNKMQITDHLIVAKAGDRRVVIRADRAVELVNVAPDAVVDPGVITVGSNYIAGVAKLPDGLVLIHDLRTFLTEAEAEGLGDVGRMTS